MPALLDVPGARLVAVASRDAGRAERFAAEFNCVAVAGYGQLLDRTDLDAVYLPLPPSLHALWAERALRAGKHVLVEKPMTTGHAEAAHLVALANAQGLVLMENMMFLHHAQHATVGKLLADGAIGEPRAFHAAFTVPPRPAGDIRLDAELGGGALLDQGVYPLRAALAHIDDELVPVGSLLRFAPCSRVDYAGTALLTSTAGVPVTAEFGMIGPYRSAYEVVGSSGRIMVSRAFTPPDNYSPVVLVDRGGQVDRLELPPDRQVHNTIECFGSAVLGETDVEMYTRTSLRQAHLVDQIRASSRRVPA